MLTGFPDPEPFDGTHSSYPVFKQKARAKISIDGAVYGTEAGQVNYPFNRFTGTAAKFVLPWLNTRSTENVTLDSFWHFMDARFSDPQAKAKALDRLQSMKQRSNEGALRCTLPEILSVAVCDKSLIQLSKTGGIPDIQQSTNKPTVGWVL